jgi:hypothetical protein
VFTRPFVRPIPPARALASGGTTGPARFLSMGAVWAFAAILTAGGCSGLPFGGGDGESSTTQDGGSTNDGDTSADDGNTGDANANADDANADANANNADNAGDDGAAAGTTDACTLLTTEEVAAAMGTEVNDGEDSGSGDGASECTWESKTSGVPTMLTVVIHAGVSYDQVKEGFQSTEPVSGVGDEAFFGTGLNTLMMRKGEAVVQFLAIGNLADDAAKLELMKEVAVKVAERV